uniref:Angiotensin-converting enzyme n=1 Tax=Ditylenchus dipsaci TaxID=166011 RepID=A0A915EEQ1_9BILA
MNSLNPAELEKYNQVLARINQIFTTTPLCELGSKEGTACLLKFGDLHSLLQSNQNAKDNLNWWKSWRMAAGPNLTDAYAELIESTNKAAKENGFSNGGAMWRSVFELPDVNGKPQVDIQDQMEQVYQQILPFYKQLHGYIRPRLASIYASKESGEGLTRDGPLPVHLLKSLNGESWSGHYELTRPFAEDDQKIDAEILEISTLKITQSGLCLLRFTVS